MSGTVNMKRPARDQRIPRSGRAGRRSRRRAERTPARIVDKHHRGDRHGIGESRPRQPTESRPQTTSTSARHRREPRRPGSAGRSRGRRGRGRFSNEEHDVRDVREEECPQRVNEVAVESSDAERRRRHTTASAPAARIKQSGDVRSNPAEDSERQPPPSGAMLSALITTLPGNGWTPARSPCTSRRLAIESSRSAPSSRSKPRRRPKVSASNRRARQVLQIADRPGEALELRPPRFSARPTGRDRRTFEKPTAIETARSRRARPGKPTGVSSTDRGPPRRHHPGHLRVDGIARVAQAHAEVLRADRAPGLRRDPSSIHLASLRGFFGACTGTAAIRRRAGRSARAPPGPLPPSQTSSGCWTGRGQSFTSRKLPAMPS